MKLTIGIIKTPAGKYIVNGTIPVELCELVENEEGQKCFKTPVYDSYEEAESAIKPYII